MTRSTDIPAGCLAALLLGAAACFAQSPTPESNSTSQPAPRADTSPASQPAAVVDTLPPVSRRTLNYFALRYNDDFSYLDGPPESYQHDFFDPIKNMHLGEVWRLTIGGDLRVRVEATRNMVLNARYPASDTYSLQRVTAHASLRYKRLARFYIEGMDSSLGDRDQPQLPLQENRFDLNQGFVDLALLGERVPLTLRAGRAILSYGRERLVGGLEWANVPRRYDGAQLLYHSPTFDLDVFWTKPIVFAYAPFTSAWEPRINEGLERKPDHWREEQQFFGLYSTYKGVPRQTIDVYLLGLTDKGDLLNTNGRFGDLTLFTLGSRLAGTLGPFDHDSEIALQRGVWAGDTIRAWAAATEVGYTLRDVPMTPRIAAGFDYASGDRTRGDDRVETFNQLFPTGHAFLGYIDIVGRQNTLAPSVNVTVRPRKDLTVRAFYYHFWLASETDALFNSGGVATRRDPSGASGRDVGDEFDLTVNWQIDAHSSVLLGFSYFWPGDYLERFGRSIDGSFYYVQWQYRF